MSPISNIWWLGPLGLTVLRLLYFEARLSRARSKGGLLVFSASIGVRLLFGVGVVGFATLTVLGIGHEEAWLLGASTAIVVCLCFAWPVTITLGPDGIAREAWWRSRLIIPWSAVTGIERASGGEIEVFGKQGQNITFTRFHIDPPRFQSEVMRRANLKDVIETSGPTTLRL
jgi:hypothetical protein